jgi:hypothetical protein
VLVAIGHRSYDPLSDGLRAAAVNVTVIGDARAPGQIFDATQAGRDAVVRITHGAGETPHGGAEAGWIRPA